MSRPKGSKNKTSRVVSISPLKKQLLDSVAKESNIVPEYYQVNLKLTRENASLRLQVQALKDSVSCLVRVINNGESN